MGGVPAFEYLHALCAVLMQPVRSCALVRQGVPVPEGLHASWASRVQPRLGVAAFAFLRNPGQG